MPINSLLKGLQFLVCTIYLHYQIDQKTVFMEIRSKKSFITINVLRTIPDWSYRDFFGGTKIKPQLRSVHFCQIAGHWESCKTRLDHGHGISMLIGKIQFLKMQKIIRFKVVYQICFKQHICKIIQLSL